MNKTYRMHACRPGPLLLGIALACGVAVPAHATHPAHIAAADDQRTVITSAEERGRQPHALPASLESLVAAHQSVASAYAGAVMDEALCRADSSMPRAVN